MPLSANGLFGKKFIFMIPEWNENFNRNKKPEWLEEKVMSFRYYYSVNKYREICGNEMNSLQNESTSGIMWPFCMTSLDVTWPQEKGFSYNLRRTHIFLLVVLLCLYLNFSSWREFHLLPRCFLLDIVKVQCWRALYLSVINS